MGRAALVVAALLGVSLVSGCGTFQTSSGDHEMSGTLLDPPFVVKDAPLVAESGSAYSLVEDTDKELTLVFFGYTHCPDICGIVMSTLASAMTRLSDEERDAVDVVFVTTDPARDTPEVAADYATNFDPDFIGVSGDLPRIIEVAKPLGIAVEQRKESGSGDYEVTHGTQIVAIDDEDDGIAYWSEDVSSAQLAADITYLLSERS